MLKHFMSGLLGLACAAGTAHAGWEYTSETKADGGRQADAQNAKIHSLVDGDKARIEFVESQNPLMGAGTYLLTTDAGKSVRLVKPADKCYSEWDMKKMMGMAGGIMGMMNMKVKDQKAEKLLEEKGPSILGFPTMHYKFRTSYTMEVSFMGMTQANATVNEQELWTTTALKDAAFNFAALQRDMKTGNDELDKLIATQMNQAQGFPLKAVIKNSAKGANGREQNSTVTTEVLAVKQTSIAADQFVLPAGFEERDLSPMSALMGAGGKQNGDGKQGVDANAIMKMLQEQMKKQQQ
jgi:hypothetical protein